MKRLHLTILLLTLFPRRHQFSFGTPVLPPECPSVLIPTELKSQQIEDIA